MRWRLTKRAPKTKPELGDVREEIVFAWVPVKVVDCFEKPYRIWLELYWRTQKCTKLTSLGDGSAPITYLGWVTIGRRLI